MRRLVTITALAGSMSLLQGCLYYRLTQTYHQLCSRPPQISLQYLDSGWRAVHFERPTLYDKDVACLMGAAPSTTETTTDGQLWRYEARPLGPASHLSTAIVVELNFDLVGGHYRLAQVKLPPRLEQVLSPQLVERAIVAACNGQLDRLNQSAAVDLSGIDPAELPDRAQVLKLLGPSNDGPTPSETLAWVYCLENCAAHDLRSLRSRIDVHFDRSGYIEQVSTDYLQYYARADFGSQQALVGFRGSLAQIAWNCGL